MTPLVNKDPVRKRAPLHDASVSSVNWAEAPWNTVEREFFSSFLWHLGQTQVRTGGSEAALTNNTTAASTAFDSILIWKMTNPTVQALGVRQMRVLNIFLSHTSEIPWILITQKSTGAKKLTVKWAKYNCVGQIWSCWSQPGGRRAPWQMWTFAWGLCVMEKGSTHDRVVWTVQVV